MSCTALTIKTMPRLMMALKWKAGAKWKGSGSCTQPAEAMPEKSMPPVRAAAR